MRKMEISRKSIIIGIAFTFLIVSISSAQCAMCRAVLESGEQQEIAQGINNGIVYLMIIPYVLIAIVGYFIFKSRKKTGAK